MSKLHEKLSKGKQAAMENVCGVAQKMTKAELTSRLLRERELCDALRGELRAAREIQQDYKNEVQHLQELNKHTNEQLEAVYARLQQVTAELNMAAVQRGTANYHAKLLTRHGLLPGVTNQAKG